MGWESGITLGANAVSGFATTEAAKAQSKAIAQTAENEAANLANKTSRTEGALEASFLKGGIALTGAGGPAAIFQQAGQQGITDIHRTIDNANASIKDTMNKARTQALEGIAGGFSKLGAGTIASTIDKVWDGSLLQTAWNGMTGNLDPSPMGTGRIGEGLGGLY